jgi:hypothetical protein
MYGRRIDLANITNYQPTKKRDRTMCITEAHDYTSKEQARLRYREIYGAYKRGEETLGVLAMYEHAALDAGCSQAELSATRMGIAL